MSTEKRNRMALRIERVQKLCTELENGGFLRTDLSISPQTANTVAMLTALLPIVVHILLHGLFAGWTSFSSIRFDMIAILCIPSFVVHELIHGLFFGMFAPGHFRSIEFGIMWKSLNPYCYCAKPISKAQYLISVLMPGFILGTCVGVLATVFGSATLLIFSAISYLGASGDMFVACKLLRFPTRGGTSLFLDHPEKPGLLAFTKMYDI